VTDKKVLLTAAFDVVMFLHEALSLPSVNDMGGLWTYQVDERWYFAVNAMSEEQEVKPPRSMAWIVKPYTCAVWFNGWFAGEVSPGAGWFAAGEAANERTFVAAVLQKIEEVNSGHA
jgi:hypothetical protein